MTDEADTARDRGRVSPAIALALVVVVGTVVGGVALAQSTADKPSGRTILENSHEQYRNAESLTGSAVVTVSNATENRSATVEFALERPDNARVAVTHNGTTVTAGTNGTVAWVSAPAFGVQRVVNVPNATNASSRNVTALCEAVTTNGTAALPTSRSVPAETGGMNASAIDCESLAAKWSQAKRTAPANWSTTNLTATRTGTTTLNGTEAYVVAVEHENESVEVRGTVWVATEDYRVLKQRVTHGTNATTVRYHNQRFNVSIHDSTFAPPTRDGTGMTTYGTFEEAQSATDRDLLTLTADGFGFETATVTHRAGGTTVVQQYTNASTGVTLVTTTADQVPYQALDGTAVTVDGQNATAATVSGRTVVVWTDGGVTHAVVTDQPTGETVALAETVSRRPERSK
jgi:outer membrane lipoprotein-sorting protein